MANLKEQDKWEDGVYQIEENDPVLGGENGVTNRPIKQLANRTLWLKKALELFGKKAAPKDLTATSVSAVQADGHTHKLPTGTTSEKGVVRLNSQVTNGSEQEAATPKAVKTAYDKASEAKTAADTAQTSANAAQRTANDGVSKANAAQASANAAQRTANDGVSKANAAQTSANAAQRTADDGVSKANAEQTSANAAQRTANDGVSRANNAQRSADKANTNANGRVSKHGDTIDGDLRLNGQDGKWSKLQFGTQKGAWELEVHPESHNIANRRFNMVYSGDSRVYLTFPTIEDDGDTVAYRSWAVNKSGDTMKGILRTVGIASKQFGMGSYSEQYDSGAPFMVEETDSKNRDTYHPFVKGRVRSKNHYGAALSFGYTTKQGDGDGFGRGIINLVEDNGKTRIWGFEHNGEFRSAGDVITSSGKSLNTAVQLSDYRSQWGATGWVKLPNGLILQWGKTPVIHDESSKEIVFPIAFPNKVLNIQLTENQMRTVEANATHLAALNVTNTKFTFKMNSTLPIDTSADWFAIGY